MSLQYQNHSTRDDGEARRQIAVWQGMVARWNDEADAYRMAAREAQQVSPFIVEEAEKTLDAVQKSLHLCDIMTDTIAAGHPLMGELLRIGRALENLSESLDRSIRRLEPLVAAGKEIAGLKYLVSALRADAARAVQG